jgi:Zn finger protein HypA/HybF involved in hydrogenase expression
MDAKCPKCDQVANTDEEFTKVTCPHCKFKSTYDEYIEIMKDNAINMAVDYIPDRPGF